MVTLNEQRALLDRFEQQTHYSQNDFVTVLAIARACLNIEAALIDVQNTLGTLTLLRIPKDLAEANVLLGYARTWAQESLDRLRREKSDAVSD